ncbi:MAG: hypothetical protein AAGC72_07630 [Planctomycetota bacterium]
MPTETPVYLINPTNFNTTSGAVNTVHPGITGFRYSKRGPRIARRKLEGQMTPSIAVQVASNDSLVSGTIAHDSSTLDALAGTLVDQFEVTGFDGVGQTTVTKRFTNVQFESFDESFNDQDFQGNTLSFTADSVATV